MNIEEAIEEVKTMPKSSWTASTYEATRILLNELEKKDKVIDEIEDLCIRKSDEEGQEYGGVIIWNFANKIMDIIKKHKNSAK